MGWIELDPRSTAARNAKFKDSWLKGNMIEDKQNQNRVVELANRIHKKLWSKNSKKGMLNEL